MNIMTSIWSIIIVSLGVLLPLSTFLSIKNGLSHTTPPIPIAMAVMGVIIVLMLYFILVWYLTHIKVRRILCYKKSFWGPKLCRGYTYWRIGLGWGFLEIGGSCAGLYLPREDAVPGKPRAMEASELNQYLNK